VFLSEKTDFIGVVLLVGVWYILISTFS